MVEVRLAGPLWHCAAWLVFAAGETSKGSSPRSFGATFCSFPPRLLRLRLAIHYNIHDSDLSMPGGHVLERFVRVCGHGRVCVNDEQPAVLKRCR